MRKLFGMLVVVLFLALPAMAEKCRIDWTSKTGGSGHGGWSNCLVAKSAAQWVADTDLQGLSYSVEHHRRFWKNKRVPIVALPSHDIYIYSKPEDDDEGDPPEIDHTLMNWKT
jgi:hypothetical protein